MKLKLWEVRLPNRNSESLYWTMTIEAKNEASAISRAQMIYDNASTTFRDVFTTNGATASEVLDGASDEQ